MIRIELAWPARPLWANDRSHWRKKAAAIAKARREAWLAALSGNILQAGMVRPMLAFYFHPPTRRLPDLQNMPHTQKAAIDGIADAIGIDDKHFFCFWPTRFSEPVRGGKVVIDISDGPHDPT